MDLAVLVARLLLAAVFVVAAAGKYADVPATRAAVGGLGLPSLISWPVAVLLPAAEFAIALALIPERTALWGALGATTLLILFLVVVVANLSHGRRPDCHCFGQWHSAPLGRSTLLRNGGLVAVALFVLWRQTTDPMPSLTARLSSMPGALAMALTACILLAVVVLLEGWLAVSMLRQQGRLLRRLDDLEARLGSDPGSAWRKGSPAAAEYGPPIGSTAPEFRLSSVAGQTLTLAQLRALGRAVLLVFTDPGCGPCLRLLPDIARWQKQGGERVTIALISAGTLEVNRLKAKEHDLAHVLVQNARETAQEYGADGTPSALLINPDGSVATSLSVGEAAVRDQLNSLVGPLSTSGSAVLAVRAT